MKLLVQRIRQAWPNVRIIFRGDRGFCRWRLMRWCDKHDVGYIIGLARNAALTRLAEHLQQGENTRFIVTNLSGGPQNLYDELYCQRGEAENRIKEQQLGLFADRTSCHDFVANQFRVLLSAAAYILMDTLRREGLADTELANAQVDTIRNKLLKIGARVICSVRRIVLHLAGGYPFKELFACILARLRSRIPVAASG